MTAQEIIDLAPRSKVYLVTDHEIRVLYTPDDDWKQGGDGKGVDCPYEPGKVFDAVEEVWWPGEYLEATAERAVAKFMVYEQATRLERELERELGPDRARQVIREVEEAGGVADPWVAIRYISTVLADYTADYPF